MTGAITCLQHWRDICNVPRGCSECPLKGKCPETIFLMSDEEIADFVRTVEKEYKKMELKNE